jgi:hypothetical protein
MMKNRIGLAAALGLVITAFAWKVSAQDDTTSVKVQQKKDGVAVDVGDLKVRVDGVPADQGGSGDTAVGAGRKLAIGGNGKTVTHACGGDAGALFVTITGNGHHVDLTGACKEVAITGNGHHVSIESAGKIAATGNSIEVTYKSGLNGKPPKIAKTGNKVTITKIEE